MTIKENIGENIDDYKLKSDQELLDSIGYFGCGETEFHTADIERLILEKQHLEKGLKDLINWMKSEDAFDAQPKMGKRIKNTSPYKEFINRAEKTLEL